MPSLRAFPTEGPTAKKGDGAIMVKIDQQPDDFLLRGRYDSSVSFSLAEREALRRSYGRQSPCLFG